MIRKLASILILLATFGIVACGGSSSTKADDECDAACQDELDRLGETDIE
ncbi:MAG: hypothetical protein MJY78_02470 [Fibrobacter sp.]|nr:hypothetical protein [Fibrobacter sp.]